MLLNIPQLHIRKHEVLALIEQPIYDAQGTQIGTQDIVKQLVLADYDTVEDYQAALSSAIGPHMPDQATIIAEAQANREKADERKAERDAARAACQQHETTIATLQERIKELEAQLPPAEEPAADHA